MPQNLDHETALMLLDTAQNMAREVLKNSNADKVKSIVEAYAHAVDGLPKYDAIAALACIAHYYGTKLAQDTAGPGCPPLVGVSIITSVIAILAQAGTAPIEPEVVH